MAVYATRRMLSHHHGQLMELIRVVHFVDAKGTPLGSRYECSNGLFLAEKDLVFTGSQEEQDELIAMEMNAKLAPMKVDFIPSVRTRRRIF